MCIRDRPIPVDMPAGNGYRIRVQSYTDPGIRAFTGTPFAIGPPVLRVTRPNGGELWPTGSVQHIAWESHTEIAGPLVRIGLHKGAGFVRWIHRRTPNDGAYTCIVPVDLTEGADYRIRVQSFTEPSLRDFSDAPFAID